jgi:hypothetical protein
MPTSRVGRVVGPDAFETYKKVMSLPRPERAFHEGGLSTRIIAGNVRKRLHEAGVFGVAVRAHPYQNVVKIRLPEPDKEKMTDTQLFALAKQKVRVRNALAIYLCSLYPEMRNGISYSYYSDRPEGYDFRID